MKIIKISFSGGSLGKNNGAELAPDEIVKQMHDLFLNEDGVKPVFDIDEVKVESANIEETNKNIFEKVKQIREKAILLGGDHSITYACFKGFAVNNSGAGLIIFDAHPDCETDFDPPTQEDYVRMLIKEKIVDKDKVIIIGIRNWHDYEKEYLIENKIRFFNMKQIFDIGVSHVCDTVMETAMKWPALYLSIDIDAVDPAFAPATGYIEPGGLSSRQMIYFLQRLKKLKNFRMADIVEVNPKKDVNCITSKLAAKFVVELF